MDEASRVDRFLDTYKQLEGVVRAQYNLSVGDSALATLRDAKGFGRYADDIDYCRQVRNFLQHKPKVLNEYAIEPSEQMIEFLQKLVDRVGRRLRAIDIAIKPADVVGCAPGDLVTDVVATMYKMGHSYAPVLVDNRVVGVFDKDSVFTCLAESCSESLPSGARVSDLASYTALDGRKSESFTFHARNEYVDKIEDVFDERSAAGKRVAVAFVTEHGDKDERMLGLFTAWDIIAANAASDAD